MIGERYVLRVDCADDVGVVLADQGQIEHVVINLVLNARDAMPDGGEIRIRTRRDGADAVVSVTDAGIGMDEATQSRMFEPFFTTKAEGRGSGLGLSTAYGIATQSGGTITVASSPGQGSTVSLALPRKRGLEAVADAAEVAPYRPRRATVLVAEDREVVRTLVVTVLERAGMRVLAAAGGDEALALAGAHEGPLDLLLTDVVMPGLNGDELAARLDEQQPGVRVLYMSGYTEQEALRKDALAGEIEFIEKPFSPRELVERVSGVLAGEPALRALG